MPRYRSLAFSHPALASVASGKADFPDFDASLMASRTYDPLKSRKHLARVRPTQIV
jgi:hypothetical protein